MLDEEITSGGDAADQWVRDVEQAAREGRWTQAAAYAERALSLGLAHPRLFHARAVDRDRRGDSVGALADLRQARELDPSDQGVANALGAALTRAGAWLEAIPILEDAVAAEPDLTISWLNLGKSRMAGGRMAEAEAAFQQVTARAPGNLEATARLATLALHRGDSEAGRNLAVQVLAQAPSDPEARRALIEADLALKRYPEAEREARAWLATPQLSSRARVEALALLGDALDGQTRCPEAFGAYTASRDAFASVYGPQFHPLDQAPLATLLSSLATEATALGPSAWVRPVPPSASECASRSHIFLMGFMRSGTTLLEQALARSPDVVTVEEMETLANSGAELLGQPAGLSRIAAFGEEEIAQRREAYWRYLKSVGIEPTGKVLIDKLPFNGIKLPLIAKLFPEAKVIFAIRDPRDVVLSCFQRRMPPNGFSYEMRTLAGAARFYASYMALVRRYREVLPLTLLDHRHEDLLRDVEHSIREACDFIGIDYRPELTSFEQAARQGQVMSQSSRQLSEGLNTRGLDRWRRYQDQLAPILPVLQPWVEAFGYSSR